MPASDCRDHPCTLGRIALCARAFAPHSGSSANMRGAPVLWCDAPSGSGAAVCVWVADGSYSPWSKLLQGRAWVRRRLSNARFALFWLFCDAAAGALPLTATVPLFGRSRCQVAYFITYTLWTTKPENARFCRRDFIHFPHNCVAQIVFTTFIQWCPAPSCPRRRRHGRPSARRRLRRAVPFAQTLLSRRDMARRVLASSFLSCSGAVDDLEAQRGISSKQLP